MASVSGDRGFAVPSNCNGLEILAPMTAPMPPRPATPSRLLSQDGRHTQSVRGFRLPGQWRELPRRLAVTNSVVSFPGISPPQVRRRFDLGAILMHQEIHWLGRTSRNGHGFKPGPFLHGANIPPKVLSKNKPVRGDFVPTKQRVAPGIEVSVAGPTAKTIILSGARGSMPGARRSYRSRNGKAITTEISLGKCLVKGCDMHLTIGQVHMQYASVISVHDVLHGSDTIVILRNAVIVAKAVWRRKPVSVEPFQLNLWVRWGSRAQGMLTRASRPSRDQVDLDSCAARQRRHANARPCRAALRREVLGIDAVHRLIVILEVRQEDAHREHVLEPETAAGEHPLQIRQHLPRLGFDACWIGRVGRGR